jgi:mono/diheme cytochrome c family protein
MPFVFLLLLALQEPAERRPGQATHTEPTIVRKTYDMRKLAEPPALSEVELAGRRLFAQRCGLCHDPLGQARTQGPWLDRTTVRPEREANARRIIEEGSPRMPGFRHALSPAQIDRIVAFLKTVTPEQNPRAAAR